MDHIRFAVGIVSWRAEHGLIAEHMTTAGVQQVKVVC